MATSLNSPGQPIVKGQCHLFLLLGACLFWAGCQKTQTPQVFVGVATNRADWPYRYRISQRDGVWSGDVDLRGTNERWVPWEEMNITSQKANELTFRAAFGGPGRAMPATWLLELGRVGDKGFPGKLTGDWVKAVGSRSIDLQFTVQKTGPNGEPEGLPTVQSIVGQPDDSSHTAEALLHELALARQAWEREQPIAERIAQLRSDATLSRGVSREWTGPAWVKSRVKPQESKYFERIWAVYLGGTAATDSDVRALSSLTELRELYLHRTAITDAALTGICALQKLSTLHLGNTKVSDAGIEALSCLANVKELYLFETKITEAGGQRLRAKLPNAKVEW
ncbi:MAG: hypothetical protein RLZZ265_2935 [Verrucomicrobiota bacterium]